MDSRESADLTEGQRSLWVKSMQTRAAINSAIRSVTTDSKQSECHKDASEGRIEKGHDDILKVKQFLMTTDPLIAVKS